MPVICDSPESDQVSKLRFSQVDQLLLACRWNGIVEIWETKTGTMRHCLPARSCAVAAAFLENGTKLISSSNGTCVQIPNMLTGEVCWKEPHGLRGPNGVYCLELSPDGSSVACSGFDNQIVIWNLGQPRKRLDLVNPSVVMNIGFSPDGRFLAIAGCKRVVRIYDTSTGVDVRRIDTGRVRSVGSVEEF